MSNDNNVKHYRKIKKLTQEDIAKLLYVDRSVYAKKEKGYWENTLAHHIFDKGLLSRYLKRTFQ